MTLNGIMKMQIKRDGQLTILTLYSEKKITKSHIDVINVNEIFLTILL